MGVRLTREKLPGMDGSSDSGRHDSLKCTGMACWTVDRGDLIACRPEFGWTHHRETREVITHSVRRLDPWSYRFSPSFCEVRIISSDHRGSARPESLHDLPNGHSKKVEQQELEPDPT